MGDVKCPKCGRAENGREVVRLEDTVYLCVVCVCEFVWDDEVSHSVKHTVGKRGAMIRKLTL